jgi:negative regulator of sigma E activity
MSECKESLSALMDGETSDFETRRLLQQVDEDPALGQTWRRYHLARSVIQGEALARHDMDLSERLSLALAEEPAHGLEQPAAATRSAPSVVERLSGVRRTLASMAVAASVTAIVIFGANNFAPVGEPASSELAQSSQNPQIQYPSMPATASADLVRTGFGDRVAPAGNRSEAGSAEVIRLSQGLNDYIDQHRQLVSVNQPRWRSTWLPEGYKPVRHELLPHGEVMMFSDGQATFSVTVEELGYQRSPAGVARSGGLLAVGRQQGDRFVTVVGDVPLMIADRIASNVEQVR